MSYNAATPDGEPAIRQLLAPERNLSNDPLLIFSFTEIGYSDTVADIGCGPGFFTLPLAKTLYNGKLYALDIDPEMLEACRDRVAAARLGNVELARCGEFDFPVEPGSLDGGFLAFVVDQSADRLRFLRAVRELLKPRGWCAILEWYRTATDTGPPLEWRLDPGELEALVREAGFHYRHWRELNPEQYLMLLRNP